MTVAPNVAAWPAMVGVFGALAPAPFSTWVFTRAAAEPATSTPVSESTAAILFFTMHLRVGSSRPGGDRADLSMMTVPTQLPTGGSRSSKKRPTSTHDRVKAATRSTFCPVIGHNGRVKLLLVEDDRSIASSLVEGLGAVGYEVEHVTTGAKALAATGFELVLLDLGLPDMDGRDVCRSLRATTTVPIIMLTARSEEFDRVLGLELGADDYVTKPFSLRELVARIRAVSRRMAPTTNGDAEPDADRDASRQVIGPLVVDRRTRRVHLHDDEVYLTAKEFDLLAYLATDPGAVRSRTDILEQVWDEHWYGPTKTVDAHVASIRKKLGSNGWIEAVRGVGFRLEPPA